MKKITLLPLLLLLLPLASGVQIESISTDPSFLSAGMQTTLAVTLYEDGKTEDRGRYIARLEPGNRLAENHARILDDDDVTIGYLPTGISFVTQHDIEILSSAPTGTYVFDLNIEDTRQGSTISKQVEIQIEQEGVEIDTTLVQTEPKKLRPGDTTAHADVRITNTGEIPLEDITLRPSFPEGIEPLYSQDEKVRIATLEKDTSQIVTIGFDIDKPTEPGRKTMTLLAAYEDDEGNDFEDTFTVPLRIEGRPLLTVEANKTATEAGETRLWNIAVTNQGSQDAEGVEARLLLHQGQPFTPSDRSVYIGLIEPGETKQTSFSVTADRTARQGEHNVEIELRSTGERDEGDTNVYVERKSISVLVSGATRSPLIPIGIGALGTFLLVVGFKAFTRQENDE